MAFKTLIHNQKKEKKLIKSSTYKRKNAFNLYFTTKIIHKNMGYNGNTQKCIETQLLILF